jgi:hypothetical protein
MGQILLNAAYLKATGAFGTGEPTISSSGAKYQDFRGSTDYVRAHRATLSVNIANKNIAEFARPDRPHFKALLIAPQAVTDALPPPANYGDRLLEIVSELPTINTVKWVVSKQRTGHRVETNLVLDGIVTLLHHYQRAYDTAINEADAIRRKKGWSGHLSLHEAAKLLSERGDFAVPGSSDSHGAKDVHEIIEKLRTTGPQNPLVDERMRDLEFNLVKAGPSRYGDLVDIYLSYSKEHAERFLPALLSRYCIEEACARLDEANTGTNPPSST